MDQKYTQTTLQHGNAVIVVYRPEIDEETRARREKEVVRALAQYGRETMKKERKVNV